MDVLYILIPLSVVLVFLIGWVFWWSLGSGQFDDLEGPAHRILQDDDAPPYRSACINRNGRRENTRTRKNKLKFKAKKQ